MAIDVIDTCSLANNWPPGVCTSEADTRITEDGLTRVTEDLLTRITE